MNKLFKIFIPFLDFLKESLKHWFKAKFDNPNNNSIYDSTKTDIKNMSDKELIIYSEMVLEDIKKPLKKANSLKQEAWHEFHRDKTIDAYRCAIDEIFRRSDKKIKILSNELGVKKNEQRRRTLRQERKLADWKKINAAMGKEKAL